MSQPKLRPKRSGIFARMFRSRSSDQLSQDVKLAEPDPVPPLPTRGLDARLYGSNRGMEARRMEMPRAASEPLAPTTNQTLTADIDEGVSGSAVNLKVLQISQMEEEQTTNDDPVQTVVEGSEQLLASPLVPLAQGAQKIISQTGIQDMVLNGLEQFKMVMPGLMIVFEKVANLHPIAEGAFFMIKAVYDVVKLYNKNDQQVSLLRLEMRAVVEIMCRMETLKGRIQLPLTQPLGPDVDTTRLTTFDACCQNVAMSVKKCYTAWDTYRRKNVLTRVLQGTGWSNKFAELLLDLKTRKDELDRELRFLMAKKIATIEVNTVKLLSSVDEIKELLKSRFLADKNELAMRDWVDENNFGEEEVRKDDTKFNSAVDQALKLSQNSTPARGDKQDREKEVKEMKAQLERLRKEVRDELRVDPAEAIEKNLAAVESRLGLRVDQLRVDIRREGDKIIQEVRKGAHDKLSNTDIQKLWEESKWNSAVKARYFIVALRELYLDDGFATSEDSWAVQYIDLKYARTIAEAVDVDASGFVTVSEMNQFLKNKPKEWSIPVWIAFWAIGWRQLQVIYAKAIEDTAAKMIALASRVLPQNWSVISFYLRSVMFACYALTGSLAQETDEEFPPGLTLYRSHEENRMANVLERVHYKLRSGDVELLLDSGCIEKSGLLLIHLLLLRHCDLIRAAQHLDVSEKEFYDAKISLDCVSLVFFERARYVSLNWENQGLDSLAQSRSFACGVLEYALGSEKFYLHEYGKKYPRQESDYAMLDDLEKNRHVGPGNVRHPQKPNTLRVTELTSYPSPERILSYRYREPVNIETWVYEMDLSEKDHSIGRESLQRYPFLGRWTGRDFGLHSVVPPSVQAMQLWLADGVSGTSGTLRGIIWSSRGRADIDGSFVESGGADELTHLRLNFKFRLDLALGAFESADLLEALVLPRSSPEETYTSRVSFVGQFLTSDGGQLVGEWIVQPDAESIWDRISTDLASDSDSDTDADTATESDVNVQPDRETDAGSFHEPLAADVEHIMTYRRRIVPADSTSLSSSEQPQGSPQTYFNRLPMHTNTARSRWSTAIQTIILQQRGTGLLSSPLWRFYESRRDKRRTCLSLLYRLRFSSISAEETEILRSSMAHLSPEDGWFYMMRLKWAFLWARTHGYVTCDACHEDIVGGRLICMDCHEAWKDDTPANSFDLCIREGCISAAVGSHPNGSPEPHEGLHSLIL